MPDLHEFQDRWEQIVQCALGGGYQALSNEEKIWFNAQSLIQAIDNGGLISYYYNSAADTLGDCMHALEVLGAEGMLSLITKVNTLFTNGVPVDVCARNEIINSWPDDGSIDEFLGPIEASAMSEARHLVARLVAFILNSRGEPHA